MSENTINNAAKDAASEFADMLDRLHLCALAEYRVRERHQPFDGIFGNPICRACRVLYPCPTLRDLIGEPEK